MATASLEEDKNVTSGRDILNLLSKCKKCLAITNNGNYITSYMHLPTLVLPKTPTKLAIIVNSERDYSQNVGHWFVLSIFFSSRSLIVCDGLHQLGDMESEVVQAIIAFANINGLTYKDLNVKCQVETSKTCGFICLFFVAKTSLLPQNGLTLLHQVLTRNAIHANEEYAIKFVKQHYV